MPLCTRQLPINRVSYTASGGGGGSNLFFDDFTSGDFSKQLNGANFWEGATNCAVISGFSSAGNTGNCVRFNFDIAATAISELRYNLGNQFSEVWFKMRMYYPTGSESPTRGPEAQLAGDNNKFFRCWADDAGGSGNGADPRFGASYFSTSPAGDARIGAQAGIFPESSPASTSQIPQSTPQYFDLVNDTYRGTWVVIEFRFKASSGAGALNGEWQCWRNGTQTNLITGLDAYNFAGTYTGMRKGYLMGAQDVQWTNTGTAMFVDYFSVSTTGRAT